MPKADSYGQGIQYPVLSDAPNAETAFGGVVNGLAPLSVLRFANANERAATLTGAYAAQPGMISYLIAEDRWDTYGADAVWRPMSPGPWKPLTFSSGYTAFEGSPGYRIVNGDVQLRGQFKRTDGSDLVTATSTLFCNLPVEARPIGATRVFIAAANFTTSSGVSRFSGRITINSDGQAGYMMGAGSTSGWLSLDGIRYSIA
ncbi:hypothetical protein ABT096_29770 [Streptomyces sp. NPDC002561]|uniref:hypothetical protein n=1 Tax=Streptomyces sp. NPDC002561 TaxID=3154418 RepID=UPI00332AF345